ncbi:MAG: ABC transporter permease [Armatimonadetes bacterium]|nr:ABC transporter permease [Armatimonadota bacterium]
MARFIFVRLLALLPIALGVALVAFLLLRLVPGDPARVILGADAGAEDVARVRAQLGLDRPLAIQFGIFVGRAVRGDLGYSYYFKDRVMALILSTLPATVELSFVAMVAAVAVAVPLGVVAALRRQTLVDYGSMAIAVFGVAMPPFWLGILLIYLFGVQLRWLPTMGIGGHFWTWDGLRHMLLPAATLGALMLASTTRLTRAAMLDVLGEEYVRTARAKGLTARQVIYRHALRNALIPVVTNLGLQMGNLLGGAFLTETVFAWPGIGRLSVDAMFRRDYPMVQGTLLVVTLIFLLVNLVVDVLYVMIDPRITYD